MQLVIAIVFIQVALAFCSALIAQVLAQLQWHLASTPQSTALIRLV